MDTQEKDFLDDVDVDSSYQKPKKQLSEQKLQHLQNIRVKALEKKKQMKEITEKANKIKELESLKEAKQIQKEQLAKKYDEMIENSKPKVEPKPKVEEPKFDTGKMEWKIFYKLCKKIVIKFIV
jgi:phenylalanyl-tRNA synthetase alpha subunit